MTDKERLINAVQIKLSQALKTFRIRNIDFREDDSLEFPFYDYMVNINITAKKKK